MNESGKKKRYYWLKLNEGFFDQPVIKKLRKIAGGDTYTCIYLKMMLMSVKTEGVLIYEGLEETLEKELALKLDEDETNIKVVISYLFSHHLMSEESKKNRSYLMSEVPKMTGKEGDSAERVRAHRDRKNALALQCNDEGEENGNKPLQCNNDVTKNEEQIALLQCNDDVTRGNFPPLHCNTTVTSDEKNDALLHCNSLVTTCNDDVTRCNDDVTENFKKSEKFNFNQNHDIIDVQEELPLHCNSLVTTCNENVTTEIRDKSYCSSSYLKETTTTTTKYIEPSLKLWLSEKSHDKKNPQGYEFTLLQKINNKEESVMNEYKVWRERHIAQLEKDKLHSYKGSTLLTTLGEKIILGIEKDSDNYKIYFTDGNHAIVDTLDSLSACEKRSS